MNKGGLHYKGGGIEPIEFILANDIPFCEGNVIKYIFRWRQKDGVKDLEKAKHYIEFLIEQAQSNSESTLFAAVYGKDVSEHKVL